MFRVSPSSRVLLPSSGIKLPTTVAPASARLFGRGVVADRYTDEKDSMYGRTCMNDSVTRSGVSHGLGFKLCQGISETKSNPFLIDIADVSCTGDVLSGPVCRDA